MHHTGQLWPEPVLGGYFLHSLFQPSFRDCGSRFRHSGRRPTLQLTSNKLDAVSAVHREKNFRVMDDGEWSEEWCSGAGICGSGVTIWRVL